MGRALLESLGMRRLHRRAGGVGVGGRGALVEHGPFSLRGKERERSMSVRTAGGKALSRAPEGDRTGTPAGLLSTAGPGAAPSQCYATAAGAAAVPCRRARLLGLGLGLKAAGSTLAEELEIKEGARVSTA